MRLKKSQLKIQALKNLKRFLVPSSSKKAQLKIQATENHRFPELVSLNKKSQLKIQEMAFMLVAVFLFFILVGLFVISVLYVDLQDKATKSAEEKTLAAITSLADTPELSCIASKSNCVDQDKLITLLNKTVYQNFWPFSSLRVVTFSGFDKNYDEMIECTLANYPDCELFNIYDKNVRNERAVSSFVALCRKSFDNIGVTNKCEIAKIIAGTELKYQEKNEN